MSAAPNKSSTKNINWQPSASIANLRTRATMLAHIRNFFAKKNVLEIETPLLGSAPVTDPYLNALESFTNLPKKTKLYLQTSPEYAMKRLLAAGIGSIYQICKAFRDDELGCEHNTEFTILEWYRINFNDHDLMAEIDELLQVILNCPSAIKVSYQQIFEKHLSLNPHTATFAEIEKLAHKYLGSISGLTNPTTTDYLQLLMAKAIEPNFAINRPTIIYDYPKEQAALARLKTVNQIEVAARFEVYFGKTELANGYFELTDAKTQSDRFNNDLAIRHENNLKQVPIDKKLLAALKHGLPTCAGVALGLDRLLMILVGAKDIREVLAFPVDYA